MIAFIKGTIHTVKKDYVIIENNGIGYQVYVSNVANIRVGSDLILYTYQHVREDAITLFGFSTMEEHDLFLQLISVKGVGPKIALGMLGVCSVTKIMEAIENNDVKLLKTLPGIGAKSASQIVLDLKGKLAIDVVDKKETITNQALQDAMDALKALGYKSNELSIIVSELSTQDGTCEEYIRKALALIAKRKGI